MKPIVNLNDLMCEQLRSVYDSEKQLNSRLPQILRQTIDNRLRDTLASFVEEQENNKWRLKQVFEELFLQKRGEKCEAMRYMLNEAEDLMKRSMDPEVMDAAIITALQHIIHYQIAGYGAISNYANTLDLLRVAEKVHMNLEVKKSMDRKLAVLAEEYVNLKAKTVGS